MSYAFEDGPFDLNNLPVATHPAYTYEKGNLARCKHCRQPIVYIHSAWSHASRIWEKGDPERWWWTPTSKSNGCIGAARA